MIFIVSGPGGVGKGTIVAQLVGRDDRLWLSRSWTTRKQRPSEEDNAYVFVSETQFRERVDAGGFLEWVEFLGNFYGTPLPEPKPGSDLLLEIELEGAKKVRSLYPEAVLVLVVPPSLEVQRQRLMRRGDDEAKINERIEHGRREMEEGMQLVDEVVVNDDLETAVQALAAIVDKYRTNPKIPGDSPNG